MSQIALMDVAVEFAGIPIFEGASFTVSRGDRWGLVGRNGSGKTTLVNVAAGRLQPTRGAATRASGLRVTLLDQHREFGADTTVWDAAAAPFAELRALEQSLEQQATRIGELGADAGPDVLGRYDHDLERFAREGGYTYEARVDAVLQGLGFDPAAARKQPAAQLSGGEQGRIALARQLVAPADVLLLDEPTNHLDFEMRHSLITALQDFAGAVIVVSHDRGLLRSVCDQFWLVADGAVTDFEGDLEDYSNWLEKRGSTASTPSTPKPRTEGDKRAQKRKDGDSRKDREPKRQELKSVETSLDKLSQERARLEKELAGLDYNRDPAHARKVTERHADLIRDVELLETRWLELSERLESLDG